ncbi:MAG: cytochrome c maturation protein CcmE [Deltaproteobacteria bacterium]|nr:MAG: cytochrome c maturation protein CcmE [Deltaproteobacteria bacterium]
MSKKLKYLIGAILVSVLAFVVLILSTTFRSSLQYYVTVSELMANEPKYAKSSLKVAGHASHIEKIPGPVKPTYNFMVDEGGSSIAVTFVGLVPDTFKEGSEVVVTGRMDGENHFLATDILAKCSSKYETKIDKANSK